MGWAVGYDKHWKRDIGYGVPAFCDHPGCEAEIDRGLAYVCCDQQPHGGELGCGLYFCGRHRFGWRGKCEQCHKRRTRPFAAKPDHPRWIEHKLTDESWAQWRAEHPEEAAELAASMDARFTPMDQGKACGSARKDV
jgi:hypothetical protein